MKKKPELLQNGLGFFIGEICYLCAEFCHLEFLHILT